MLITEYRTILPFTMEEYKVGQFYSLALSHINQTGNHKGTQTLKSEPFRGASFYNGNFREGQYIYNIYEFAEEFPRYLKMFIPSKASIAHEETWNAYPYIKTVISHPAHTTEEFFINIETIHCPDKGEQPNIFGLKDDKLEIRKVVFVDIANDKCKDCKKSEDPTKCKSKKTHRGPLVGNWKNCYPCICAYTLVTVHVKRPFFSLRFETHLLNLQRKIIINFNRQVFCWIDEWIDLTVGNFSEFEYRLSLQLDKKRYKKKVRCAAGDVVERLP